MYSRKIVENWIDFDSSGPSGAAYSGIPSRSHNATEPTRFFVQKPQVSTP